MDREQARAYIKGELLSYLSSKGLNLGPNNKKPFLCLNPGHNEKRPSMSYNEKKNNVHCFACGATYDTLDLIGIDYGMDLNNGEAILQKACQIYNITLDGGYQKQPKKERDTHISIHTNTQKAAPAEETEPDYTAFFDEAHSHIGETDYPQRERGLGQEVIDRFKLGYILKWKHPKAPTAPYSPRLIIPTGPHSYLARDTRPKEKLTEEQQKYAKQKVGSVRLFNLEAIYTAKKPVFITEGELDAMSIIEVGGEAMALGSTSMADNLINALKDKKPTQPLIIALDNDKAGEGASTKLMDAMKEAGIEAYKSTPQAPHKDANDALRADRDGLKTAVEEAEQQASEAINARRAEYLKTSTAHHIHEFMGAIAESVNTPAIPTGYQDLDGVLSGGLYGGRLYAIGAISSLGKTTFILQMADQIAQLGKDVLIFSLEMSRAELMAKSISRLTFQLSNNGAKGKPKTSLDITDGSRYTKYGKEDMSLINKAIEHYGGYARRIFINEGCAGLEDLGVKDIEKTIKEHIALTGNKPVVFIDYLQILKPNNERATDKQNMDKAVRALKRLSMEHKIPVVCVSSFNREAYKKEVQLEAFKESGNIEYSSDIVIGMQFTGTGTKGFDINKESKKPEREVELVLLKSKTGSPGYVIKYKYHAGYSCFIPAGSDFTEVDFTEE